jgi:membrane peptidoglycan carboxypeptidase
MRLPCRNYEISLRYDPFINPDANKERQEVILNKMCELGHITEEQRDDAKAEILTYNKTKRLQEQESKQSYYVDQSNPGRHRRISWSKRDTPSSGVKAGVFRWP